MKLLINLNKSEILQRVKAKAHKKGITDLSIKGNDASKYAYNEQAGDDEADQFVLMSSLRDSFIAESVVDENSVKPSKIDSTVPEFTFTISKPSRYRLSISFLQMLRLVMS